MVLVLAFPLSAFADVQVGDIVTMGAYEQDANLENGSEPLQWQVLDVDGDRALLITCYAIDRKPADDNMLAQKVDPWPKSSIRTWLNSDFLKTAFTEEEQGIILVTKHKTEKNPEYGTSGFESKDKLFYLSLKEAETYFADDAARRVHPTPYYISLHGVEDPVDLCTFWVLRNYGARYDLYATTLPSGELFPFGASYAYVEMSVRPAMWVKADSISADEPSIHFFHFGTGKLYWTKSNDVVSYSCTAVDRMTGETAFSASGIVDDFYPVSYENVGILDITVSGQNAEGETICDMACSLFRTSTSDSWTKMADQ